MTDLTNLLETLRKYGVTRYKTPELELDLGSNQPASPDFPDVSRTQFDELNEEEERRIALAHVE